MASSPTIIFLDLPPKTFVGIDLASFNSAPNFHGISGIPKGLHLIYTGTDASLSIRHGRWLNIKSSEVHVFQWNTDLEHLDSVSHDSPTARSARQRLPDLQKRGLVDYPSLIDASANLQKEQTATTDANTNTSDNDDNTTASQTWHSLTKHISLRLLSRLLPPSPTDPTQRWTLTSLSSSPLDTEHIPGLSAAETATALSPTQTLHLLPITLKQTWPDTAIGSARTEMARDRTWYLSHLIAQLRTPVAGSSENDNDEELTQQAAARELLGELQFCFVGVLCLANYSCLEGWKRVLGVLLTCRMGLGEVEGFFVEVVRVVRAQLGRVEDVEGGLFEMGDESGSRWLRSLLSGFRAGVNEMFGVGKEEEGKGKSVEKGVELRRELEELERWLREVYGWEDERSVLRRGMVQLEDGEMLEVAMDGVDEDEETGEYAPVIVEM